MPKPGYISHIWNRSFWVPQTDPDQLVSQFRENLELSGFTILGFNQHHFEPQGFTALWLLGESHLALHTFPETGKSYVELSSCNEIMLLRFESLCREQFEIIPHSPSPQNQVL